MFGYVRPLKSALAENDFAKYQAAYCGLCRVIGQRYGMVAQMFLNYDFAFLAMLLAEKQETPCVECRRCPIFPWRSRDTWLQDAGLELAAAESVILSYWKLGDGIEDSGFWERCLLWPLRLLLWRGYRKAAKRCPDFDVLVRSCLKELRQMEQQRLPSLDRPADAFARILQATSGREEQGVQAARSHLLYHVGRWIYLIDALDDLEEDRKSGSYNPILLQGLGDTEEGKRALQDTMSASIGMALTAYQWMELQTFSPIIENILTLGLPGMQEAVLTGARKAKKKRIIRRTTDE